MARGRGAYRSNGVARRLTAPRAGIKVHNSNTIKDSLPSLASMGSKTGVAPVTIRTNQFPKLKGFNSASGGSYQQNLGGDVIR